MSTAIELLTRQHQDVLTQMAAVEAAIPTAGGAPKLAAFVTFLEHEVAEHFKIEEQALFPILARHLSMTQGPLAVMNSEHDAFRELLKSLAGAVRSGDLAQQAAHAQEVIHLLRAHIAKEDQVLFPLAAQLLNDEEKNEVNRRAATLSAAAASSM
jgi:regulator of cell morphogenesis and NO signaling